MKEVVLMRIISGLYKGRKLDGENITGTRPTMDRVKESLFAMIQDNIKNSIVLDLFAGSGSLGIEAISNGASFCYFNDYNKKCTKVINENVKKLSIEENSKVLNLDYKEALLYFKNKDIKFNIVFLDPPYKDREINNITDYIMNNDLLLDNGLIVIEVSKEYTGCVNTSIYKQRSFSDKQIIILKK
jgi:RNA methyltransferase, RsmD family